MEKRQWRNSIICTLSSRLKELAADPLPLQLQILAAAGPAWHDGSDLSYQPIKKIEPQHLSRGYPKVVRRFDYSDFGAHFFTDPARISAVISVAYSCCFLLIAYTYLFLAFSPLPAVIFPLSLFSLPIFNASQRYLQHRDNASLSSLFIKTLSPSSIIMTGRKYFLLV